MNPPDVYIDADACPVKEDTYRVAKRYSLKVYTVSNVPLILPRADWIVPIVAGKNFDAVDDWIIEHVTKNDIVVTNDLLLVERCLKKEARPLDTRGKIFDENNIGDVMATRGLMDELRQRGALNLGPKKKEKKHHSNFLASLDKLINAAIRS